MLHKAIAIPVIDTEHGESKFLLVHDQRHHEWTFVTGGCKYVEIFNPLKCAVRELEEETRGLVSIKKGYYKYFRFTHTNKDPIENSIYHVYILHVGTISTKELDELEHQFKIEKEKMDTNKVVFKKNYDENDSMKFMNLGDILKCGTLWRFIYDKVLMHKNFVQCIVPINTKYFNLLNYRNDQDKTRAGGKNQQIERFR